jgi:four helix bundle protein
VYRVTGTGPFSRDFGLSVQIRRAAVSVLSNIAEGFERDGNKELRQFLAVAKGSAGEVRAQVALDAGFMSEEGFTLLHNLAVETGRLAGGFTRYLEQSDRRGVKYR